MNASRAELRATYRLQLTSSFGFDAACQLVPYLRDLGISHLYLSPTLEARPGSTHGYEVIDPGRLSSGLGGEEAFRRLSSAAGDAGLAVVLDVVPNHMAASEKNRYRRDHDLRERFFDIDPATGPEHVRPRGRPTCPDARRRLWRFSCAYVNSIAKVQRSDRRRAARRGALVQPARATRDRARGGRPSRVRAHLTRNRPPP